MRTRSQAPGTRARVGPLGPPGGLLPGSPARRGLTLRHPTCHLCSPTWKPRRPHSTATLLSPSDWDSGARAPHACPHALCSGSGRCAAASDPVEARGAETAFPGAVGARVGAARRVCGPDVSPGATSTSQMTTVGRRRPSSLRGHNPKSQATPGLLPTKRVCDTGPDTHREHLACSSGHRLGHVNRPLPVKTGIKHTPLGHRRLWPHPPGPRLRAGQRRDSTRERVAFYLQQQHVAGPAPAGQRHLWGVSNPRVPSPAEVSRVALPGPWAPWAECGPTSFACPVLPVGSVGVISRSPVSAASSPLVPGSQTPASWPRPEAAFSCEPLSWLGPRAAPGVQGGRSRCSAVSSQVWGSGLHMRPPIHVALEQQGHAARSHEGRGHLASV